MLDRSSLTLDAAERIKMLERTCIARFARNKAETLEIIFSYELQSTLAFDETKHEERVPQQQPVHRGE